MSTQTDLSNAKNNGAVSDALAAQHYLDKDAAENLTPQILTPVKINTSQSPITYTPTYDQIGLWQKKSLQGDSVEVTGGTSNYDYFQSFIVNYSKPGESNLSLYGFNIPGAPPTVEVQIPIIAIYSAVMKLSAVSGTYSVDIKSVDPATPVSFQLDEQKFDPKRQEEFFYLSSTSGRFPNNVAVTTHPTSAQQTNWGQNPIKVVISRITSDQGEYTGNNAVLYGYYFGDYGQDLNFFLDEGQSMKDFVVGESGLTINIDQAHSSIFVG